MISIIVHLPLRGCSLRCYFFSEYNYQVFLGQMKGKSYSNVEVFLDMQIRMEPLVIDWAKEEPKMVQIIRQIFIYC